MAQQRKNNNNNNKVNMPRPSYMLYGLAALFIIGWAIIGGGSEAPQPSDWSSVARMVEQGDVARIQVVNRDQAQVFLTEEAIEKYRKDTSDKQFGRIPENGAQFFFTIGSVDSFREDLKAATADLPRNVHIGQHGPVACTECHKAHRASVVYCTQCHSDVEIPDGWLTYQEGNDLPGVE